MAMNQGYFTDEGGVKVGLKLGWGWVGDGVD